MGLGTIYGGYEMIRRILTLGVSGMALAALSVVGTGCSGDDDDDGSSAPGGSWNLTVDSAGEGTGSAAFFESFEGETGGSFRDIPIGACIDPLAPSPDPDPIIVYEDVGTSLTAVSGGTTVTYTEVAGADVAYSAAPQAAVDDADYELSIDAEAQGSLSVPGLPYPVAITANSLGWSTMGADDAFIFALNVPGTVYRLCHVPDNGSYDLTTTVTASITSGFATVIGANYSEFSHTDGDVTAVGQAGSQFDPAALQYFAP